MSELGDFARRIDRLTTELADRKGVATRIGVAAKKDADEAVRGDLGDMSMSNWRRGRPIQIGARFDVKGDGLVEVTPTPRARGPFTVLERGRQGGTGRARRGRAGRKVSSSTGKRTWSDAVALMADRTPRRVDKEVQAAIRRAIRG